ncbi:hypothetical protein TNCV_4902191 [Trichonephila clavipes]|nr:hypothetical protein TNCV_4902191 [Trichonephila clavipes]
MVTHGRQRTQTSAQVLTWVFSAPLHRRTVVHQLARDRAAVSGGRISRPTVCSLLEDIGLYARRLVWYVLVTASSKKQRTFWS